MARVGFIGLGNMGLPMAGNLAKAGHRLTCFDLAARAREAARAAGLSLSPGLAATVADAEVVLTMLPAGSDVVAVYGETLGAAPKGTLFIDCSTIDVATARAAHERAGNAGMLSLDAPVSGGVAGARAATLTFMAGGEEATFARAEPLLAAMGRRIVHCGAPGAGQAAKICNNLILGVSMIAVSEAFVLADKLGLAADRLFAVAAASSGQCWSLTNYCPVPGLVPGSPANSDYKPGFATRLMLKDLNLGAAAANEAKLLLPLARMAQALFSAFAAAGHAEEDFSAIIKEVRSASSAG
ncbi:MAG: 3-hydroxyisobutyrate dehydrogenase [Acetobacteraceae bacterium]